jgi:hypothetical protein
MGAAVPLGASSRTGKPGMSAVAPVVARLPPPEPSRLAYEIGFESLCSLAQ